MLINKITTGFVTQVFDTETKQFVSQSFTAGDQVDYENQTGEAVEPELFEEPNGQSAYLPFDMTQPAALPTNSQPDYRENGGPDADFGA